MMKSNKFDDLKHSELVKLCLEQQDELLKLRPAPAKFKLGQVVAAGGNAFLKGQLNTHFCILSVESRNGKWLYGYAKSSGINAGLNAFHTWPEERLRMLTPAEIDGSQMPGAPGQISVAEGQGPGLAGMPGTGPPLGPIQSQQVTSAFVDEASL